MLETIKKLLLKIINDIDAGNSNIDEESAIEIISRLKELSSKDTPISKYTACQYMNMSRATFDNHVRNGEIPRGKKIVGFKELMWYKKDLDKAIAGFKIKK